MTRYLITGASGMLGHDLQLALAGRTVTALSRAELDITDLTAVMEAAAGHDVIINAAAYTRVDDAESNEDAAYAVNATGARNLAIAAAEAPAKLVHISTDYVFDGSARTPYAEDSPLNPISAYGRSKAAGEKLVLEEHALGTYIVRAAWLYGAHGSSFPKTILRLASERETVSVVVDQVGQPTWTADLAAQVTRLLDTDAPAGIYHGTNSGQTTWFEFAREIFKLADLDAKRVVPINSSGFERPAPRPAYSVLAHEGWRNAQLDPMRDWRDAVKAAAGEGALIP